MHACQAYACQAPSLRPMVTPPEPLGLQLFRQYGHGVRPELHDQLVPLERLTPHPENAKLHDDDAITASLQVHGQYRAITHQQSTGRVLTGNGTYAAMAGLGWSHCAATPLDVDDDQARRIVLVDNHTSELAGYDPGLLGSLLQRLDGDYTGTSYDPDEVHRLLERLPTIGEVAPAPSLADRFLVPPFSVLDARQGWWRDRKRAWQRMGIRSELGRDGQLQGGLSTARKAQGKAVEPWVTGSIFDPVLCEVAYRWFCPPGGSVLDPYAGGSVRGLVAARLGLRYTGVDLSAAQVQANQEQWPLLPPGDPHPQWLHGDCGAVLPTLGGGFDMALTCPPYFDLERYSDDDRDLSTMSTAGFMDAYGRHLQLLYDQLAADRFAVLVVGPARTGNGWLRDLAGMTVTLGERAGFMLYNEAVLVTSVGSQPVRAGRQFTATRTLARTHQQVLVLLKGDRRKATAACGDVDTADALSELQQEVDL